MWQYGFKLDGFSVDRDGICGTESQFDNAVQKLVDAYVGYYTDKGGFGAGHAGHQVLYDVASDNLARVMRGALVISRWMGDRRGEDRYYDAEPGLCQWYIERVS